MIRRSLFRVYAIAGLAAAIGASWYYLPQMRGALRSAVEQARASGAWGPVLLAIVYIPAAVLLVPGSWLTLAGAFAFGWWRAAAAVSVGSTLGACASFLIGRYLARDWVERKLADRARFRVLDRAVAEQGFKIVLICRLSPLLPYGLLNYAFGLTNISLARYALASWLGMLPATIAYSYLGAAAGQLADIEPGRDASTSARYVLFWAGLSASVLLTLVVTQIATRALRQSLQEK
jgi:uncharacterized membrane protein YdjX (TVP38/TMEM64 family)